MASRDETYSVVVPIDKCINSSGPEFDKNWSRPIAGTYLKPVTLCHQVFITWCPYLPLRHRRDRNLAFQDTLT